VPNVLIVDDDVDLLEGQKLFLEDHGFTVITAISMKEGIEALDHFKPDIIIADLMMEHYDSGFVFCKKVKDNPAMSTVPIIMQTAAPKEIGFTFDPSNPKQKQWIKVDEVLTKPVPLEHLLGKIHKYLGEV
jgi:CheY-like chemotaxis protein